MHTITHAFLVLVAKDVSIRIHSQLDSVEKKRSRLEQENEELRVRLQDLEVAKQVLQQELDKPDLTLPTSIIPRLSLTYSLSLPRFLIGCHPPSVPKPLIYSYYG
ncbi:hypothetical protein GOODEAATRI_003675 [Goodea atripinnis]|uniref:Uncharacterized protein n=1 Tax=Goodea atripinnis TaxID=208336 RepID=A0ABV0N0G6_9TELE